MSILNMALLSIILKVADIKPLKRWVRAVESKEQHLKPTGGTGLWGNARPNSLPKSA